MFILLMLILLHAVNLPFLHKYTLQHNNTFLHLFQVCIKTSIIYIYSY